MKRAIANRLAFLRDRFIWVCGLLFVLALGLLWLVSLGLAIYTLYRAHGEVEAGSYVGICILLALVLVALGALFVRFVNRFYIWWLAQRVNFLLDGYQQELALAISEDFKRQLRSSPAFRATASEGYKLLAESVAFYSISHTSEETDAFRKAWRARAEKLAERVAQGDSLAVEVILKAIERERERNSTPR